MALPVLDNISFIPALDHIIGNHHSDQQSHYPKYHQKEEWGILLQEQKRNSHNFK